MQSHTTQTPVRVFRGGKHGEGAGRQYAYDGLYFVKEWRMEVRCREPQDRGLLGPFNGACMSKRRASAVHPWQFALPKSS